MLHRSFKPAKCKTALKLASSRVKLLKNKKQAAYNQLKKEVSQLLESGQDRTARIRVEHVVREEKTMAAFELIEIYCELIVARLSMIESQKTCPIDLKEAITSVLFASPRCADIPELLDIRKHFTAKYGKEFVSSAVEMRPNCGVNRMLIEKLSGNAPDIQTKIKVLTAIAAEYNVIWDPHSLEETDGKPAEDLLNGPSTFQNGNKMYAEPPDVQPPPPCDQKHEQPNPDVQPPLRCDQKNDQPVNPSEHNRNPSLSSQNVTDIGGSTTVPACAVPGPKPSRVEDESKESEHSYSEERDDFSLGSKKWNMEFKDATDAAQAAAEAAELASMAARAAAELSTRDKITRQHSKESQKSSISGLREESQHDLSGPKLQSNNSQKKIFYGTNSGLNHETLDGNKKDNQTEGSERIRNQSMKSTEKIDEYSLMSPSRVGGFKPPSDDFYDEVTEKEQYSKSENSKKQENIRTGNCDNSEERGYRKQSSSASSRSHSSKSGEDHELYRKQSSSASSRSHSRKFGDDHEFVSTSNENKFQNDFGHDPFVGMDRVNIQTDSKNPKYDSGPDDDDGALEGRYSRPESVFFTSPDRNLPVYPSSTHSLIPERKSTSQSHLFQDLPLEISEGVSKANTTEPADLIPVTYDHSDGPSSESEDEVVNHRSPMRRKTLMGSGDMDPKYLHHEFDKTKSQKSANKIPKIHSDGPSSENEEEEVNHRSSLRGKTPMGNVDRNKRYFHGEFDETKSRKSSKEISVHEFKSNVQTEETPHHIKYDEFPNQSILDDSKQLNLGGLTGGNRNKGFRSLPYTRGQSSEVSSSYKSAIEEFPVAQNQKMSSKRNKKPYYKVPETSSDSDSDDFYEEPAKQKTSPSPKLPSTYYEEFPVAQNQKMSTKRNKKPYYKGPDTSSDSDSDDLYEEPAKQKTSPTFNTLSSPKLPSRYFDSESNEKKDLPDPSKGRLGGVSRRTKGSFSRPKASAEGSLSSDYDLERRTSKFSHPTEKSTPPKQATPKPRSEVYEKTSFSNVQVSDERSLSSERRTSKFSRTTEKPTQEPKDSLHDERLRTSSKVKVSEESSDHVSERRPSKFSHPTENPSSPKHATSKAKPESKHSFHEERLRPSVFDKPTPVYEKPTSAFEKPISVFDKPTSVFEKPKSAFEKPTSVFEKPTAAFEKPTSAFEKPTSVFESPKTSSSSEKIPARDNSLKKPSHVHPKLPDFESFAAHFESLRSNQK